MSQASPSGAGPTSASPASTRPNSSAPPYEAAWVDVGHISRFGPRTTIKVHARRVTLLRLKKRDKSTCFSCIDTVCYHAGGPLADGALVHVDGRTCLRCPWHSYLVDVSSGEGLYLAMDRTYQTKGVRQRVHEVEVRDDHVWVRLRLTPKDVPSDSYAYGPRFAGRGDAEDDVPEFPVPEW